MKTRFVRSPPQDSISRAPGGGHRIVDGVRIEGVTQRFTLMFVAADDEWMAAFPDGEGEVIDPSRRYGEDQRVITSPTGRGYAILCSVSCAATITASLPDNRLGTVSVRREGRT